MNKITLLILTLFFLSTIPLSIYYPPSEYNSTYDKFSKKWGYDLNDTIAGSEITFFEDGTEEDDRALNEFFSYLRANYNYPEKVYQNILIMYASSYNSHGWDIFVAHYKNTILSWIGEKKIYVYTTDLKLKHQDI